MKIYPSHCFPGKLIVLDGVGGAGKDTQASELASRLKNRLGRDVYVVNFPRYNSSPYGPVIREYLETPNANRVPAKIASLPYAMDRLEAQPAIIEALDQNNIVIAIRYVASNAAYQGAKLTQTERSNYWDWLFEYEYGHNRIVREDALIYLWLPAALAIAQTVKRVTQTGQTKTDGRDGHELCDNHVATIIETYKTLVADLPYGHTIDCSDGHIVRSIDSIASDILHIVSPIISHAPSHR